ncbi:MAG: DUF5666 domain-containing protein [Candidatus Saccharibacteria bacterium]
MADNEKNKTIKEEKTVKSEQEVNEKKRDTKGSDKTLAWVLGGLAIFIFAFVFIGCFGLVAYNRNHSDNIGVGKIGFMNDSRPRFEHRRLMGGGDMTENNQIVVNGVVTTINGQSFTIAGNGTTNTVQTNSSTQYSGSTKVSVNDSVTVSGSTNNSVFTATQVVIRN